MNITIFALLLLHIYIYRIRYLCISIHTYILSLAGYLVGQGKPELVVEGAYRLYFFIFLF